MARAAVRQPMLLLFLACTAALPEPIPPPPAEPSPSLAYPDRVAALAAERQSLAAEPRSAELRERARFALTHGVRDALIDAWIGTRWDFYGTSEVPGEGTIACGYFVSTVLRDAGLKVERVRMAQQASEFIVKSFASSERIRRFRKGDADAVVDAVLGEPEGLYAVGLDFHVGLLVRTGSEVAFCHSTFVSSEGVLCEDPRTSAGFASNYHVYGPVLEDRIVDAWLDQTPIATVTR